MELEGVANPLRTMPPILPGVLFVHGWGGDQHQYVTRASELAALGCVCVTFDLRGHAQTQAQFESVSREDGMRDVLAAYDFLAAQRNVDSDSIAIVGSSYGGYLAALLTALRPVKWLALRAPALYTDSEWRLPKLQLRREQALEKYRLQSVTPDESNALRVCREFTGDVLIVESENDTVIPRQVIVNYREACIHAKSLTYRLMEGADHGLSSEAWHRAYTALLVSWFNEFVFSKKGTEATDAEQRASSTAPKTTLTEGQPRPEA
jgi:pimeloyl-ACP methyl ester carboxylesterase